MNKDSWYGGDKTWRDRFEELEGLKKTLQAKLAEGVTFDSKQLEVVTASDIEQYFSFKEKKLKPMIDDVDKMLVELEREYQDALDNPNAEPSMKRQLFGKTPLESYKYLRDLAIHLDDDLSAAHWGAKYDELKAIKDRDARINKRRQEEWAIEQAEVEARVVNEIIEKRGSKSKGWAIFLVLVGGISLFGKLFTFSLVIFLLAGLLFWISSKRKGNTNLPAQGDIMGHKNWTAIPQPEVVRTPTEAPAPPSRAISQTTRVAVAARDGGACVQCGSTEKIEFDHVIPFSKGGTSDADNIQLLCRDCNRSKGNRY